MTLSKAKSSDLQVFGIKFGHELNHLGIEKEHSSET